MEACEILFGDQARKRFDEYFADTPEGTPERLSPEAEAVNPAHSESLNW